MAIGLSAGFIEPLEASALALVELSAGMLSDEMPAIETVLINRPDMPAAGAGETAVTVVAAAIGNAIFDATGVRLRQVPFTPARIKAAMTAR